MFEYLNIFEKYSKYFSNIRKVENKIPKPKVDDR